MTTIPIEQTPEQRAAALKAAGVSSASPPQINPASPTDVSKIGTAPQFNLPVYAPPAQLPVLPPPPIDFGVATKQTAVDKSQTDLNSALDLQGSEAQVRSDLEAQYGVPDINSNLNELYAKDAQYEADLNNLSSNVLKSNVTSEDRLAPTFAIQGEQAQAQRQAIFQQQNINIQRATNSATIAGAQGRLSMANDYIQKALDAEFTPLASKIDYFKTVLANNQATLSTAEQNQIQQQITADQQTYNEGVSNKTEIYNTMLTALKYGADPVTAQKIQNAATPEDALQIAAPFLQDPQAKYELESARLDNLLKQAQINETTARTASIGTSSSSTASSASSSSAQQKAAAQAQDAIPALQDTLNLISDIQTSPGLASSVGPNPLARIQLTSPLTGAKQSFVASVHQLINQQTLNQLLNLKAEGGTLGALSDSEGNLLRSAATKLSDWEIKDSKGNGTGNFNIDEKSFLNELNTIKTLTQRAITRASMNLISPDEHTTLSSYFNDASSTASAPFNPADFYNQ
jgi:hypothetical protein